MKGSRSHKALPRARKQDAIAMLKADHKKVKGLFSRFAKIKERGAEEDKAALTRQICSELTVHARLEEEIFYPAVREAIDDDDLMDEADVEHAGVKQLIAQLEAMQPGDDLYDAKVTVLGEQVEHHVEEEEQEMFAKVKKARVDTATLGEELRERKMELLAETERPRPSTAASGDTRRKPAKAGARAQPGRAPSPAMR